MKKVITLLTVLASLLLTSPTGYAEMGDVLIFNNSKNSDPEVVATLSDRDAIPLAFRAERMYCYVADNHKVYQLRGGVTNAHWVELDIASSMKIQGPAGSLPYIDATGLLATDMRYLGKAKFDFSGANILGSGQYISVNGIGNTVNDRSHNNINAYNSYSDGNYVMIVGERDSALGEYGVIMGKDITLNANQQFAAGRGLIGQSAGEVLFGQFNQYTGTSTNQWQGSDRLFTLGNGTAANNRSNAMVIYKNGDAVFGGNISAANMYTKLQIDSMFVVNSSGGGTGVVQSLNLAGTMLTITGSNTVDFNGWDTDASDDFSGDYNDLINQPAIFSGSYNDLTNKPSFAGWDTDASDDFSGDFNDLINVPTLFSGDYNDLTNQPDIYLRSQVDSAISAGLTGSAIQNLNLNGTQLSISGGNSISFNGWDTDASDDFSGDYNDLTNTPKLFSGDYNDLANKPALFSGNYNDLQGKPSFNGWDKNAADDFSGDYLDLINRPSFAGWDTDASDDFSGNYNDLFNKPALFSGSYADLTNKPSFAGWDTDASDDFSGDFNDLNNLPNFASWDQNAADDFSGDYLDLINTPNIYTKTQVDSMFVVNGSGGTGMVQSLNLAGTTLSITGGNAVDFKGWDIDASDDFSGNYNDLVNKPTIFSGDFADLTGIPTDLADGKITWNELDQKPVLYTKLQVDSIKQNLLDSVLNYVDSAVIAQDVAQLNGNRNLQMSDRGKTIYVKGMTSTLTLPAGANLPFNSHFELRDFGAGSFILDASAVIIRDAAGNVITSNTGNITIQDAAITVIGNDEFKIIGLYQ
jgi:hypothetical protein